MKVNNGSFSLESHRDRVSYKASPVLKLIMIYNLLKFEVIITTISKRKSTNHSFQKIHETYFVYIFFQISTTEGSSVQRRGDQNIQHFEPMIAMVCPRNEKKYLHCKRE